MLLLLSLPNHTLSLLFPYSSPIIAAAKSFAASLTPRQCPLHHLCFVFLRFLSSGSSLIICLLDMPHCSAPHPPPCPPRNAANCLHPLLASVRSAMLFCVIMVYPLRPLVYSSSFHICFVVTAFDHNLPLVLLWLPISITMFSISLVNYMISLFLRFCLLLSFVKLPLSSACLITCLKSLHHPPICAFYFCNDQ